MAAERAMSKTQERVVKLISQPRSKRSPVEINIVLPWLKKKSDILFALADTVLKDIVLNCEYLKTDKDELIIRQGDHGDCLYLLLRGSVSVYINEKKPGDEQPDINPSVKEEEEKPVAKNWLDVAAEIMGDLNGQPKQDKIADRKSLGRKIVTFSSGRAFGEVALLSEENIRTASVVADDECDLLIIRRQLYNTTVKTYHEKDFCERREFIDNSPLFMTWSAKHKRQLERALIKTCYSPDMPIISQGEEIRGLIFIRGGMAKVCVEPEKHGTQYPHMMPFPTQNDVMVLEHIKPAKPAPKPAPADSGENTSRSNSPHRKGHVSFENVHVKRKEGYAAAEKRVLNRSITLCIVKDGAMFGDVEMMHSLKTYCQSVTALTYTETYYITLRNVERLIQKRHPKTVKLLTNIVVWKMCNRAGSVQGAIVPFVQHLVFKMTEERKPVPRVPPVLPAHSKFLPERDAMFQNILQEYLKDKAPLIEPIVAGGCFYKTVMRKKARQRAVVRRKRDSVKREMMETKMRANMADYSSRLTKNMANAWLDTDDSDDEKDNMKKTKQHPMLEHHPKQVTPLEKHPSDPVLPITHTDENFPRNKAFMTEVEVRSRDTAYGGSSQILNSVSSGSHDKLDNNPHPGARLLPFVPVPPVIPKNNHTVCYVYDEHTGASVVKHYGAIDNKKATPPITAPAYGAVDNMVNNNMDKCSEEESSSNTSDYHSWASRAPSDGKMVGAPAYMITHDNNNANDNDHINYTERTFTTPTSTAIRAHLNLNLHDNLQDANMNHIPDNNENNDSTQNRKLRRSTLPFINDSGGSVALVNNRPSVDITCDDVFEERGFMTSPTEGPSHGLRARTATAARSHQDVGEKISLPKVYSAGDKRTALLYAARV